MPAVADWGLYAPFFTHAEFRCKETGEEAMDASFMDALLTLRKTYGKAMKINSGFRSIKHSRERVKAAPGFHTQGIAVDIACDAPGCYKLVSLALAQGFTGVGISQRTGQPRFIHLDRRLGPAVIYSY